MNHKKDFQNLAQRNLRSIKNQFHHFSMPALASADLLVTGLNDAAIAVARLDIQHPFNLDINGLSAPEATPAKGNGLQISCHDIS
jgi:hypothetical protein